MDPSHLYLPKNPVIFYNHKIEENATKYFPTGRTTPRPKAELCSHVLGIVDRKLAEKKTNQDSFKKILFTENISS